MHVADTVQETQKGIQVRPVDSYGLGLGLGLGPGRGHVPELEPEPEPEPAPAPVLSPVPAPELELAPASLQRPECYTWAADRADKPSTGLLRSETTLVEELHCGVVAAEPAAAVVVYGREDGEN